MRHLLNVVMAVAASLIAIASAGPAPLPPNKEWLDEELPGDRNGVPKRWARQFLGPSWKQYLEAFPELKPLLGTDVEECYENYLTIIRGLGRKRGTFHRSIRAFCEDLYDVPNEQRWLVKARLKNQADRVTVADIGPNAPVVKRAMAARRRKEAARKELNAANAELKKAEAELAAAIEELARLRQEQAAEESPEGGANEQSENKLEEFRAVFSDVGLKYLQPSRSPLKGPSGRGFFKPKHPF